MTRKVSQRAVKILGLVGLLGLVSGCWGVWEARDNGVSTSQTSNEFEMVPHAMLARENTTPDWQLGRYAFARGPDKLLVISRITSWVNTDKKEEEALRRRDHIVERVWITIPFGTPVGQDINVEDLESKFLVGYDAGEVGGGMFIQPNRLMGTVKIIEDKPGEQLVNVDVVVEPQRLPSWRVKKIVTVPLVAKGIRATAAVDELVQPSRRTRTASATPATQPSAPTTQPTAGSAGSTAVLGAEAKLSARPLVGQWSSEPPGPELKIQFTPDGRYALSTTAGGASPVPAQVGAYEIKGDFLVLHLDRPMSEGGGASSVSQSLRGSWAGGNLLLSGDFPGRSTSAPVTFKPAHFASMQTRWIAPEISKPAAAAESSKPE